MKKKLILGIFMLYAFALSAQIPQIKNSMNKYEQQWRVVEKFESEDLPKSGIQAVDKILKQAVSENNTLQVIKALIYKNKYKIVLDEQDGTLIFADLEALLDKTEDVAEKSLLHSMLGELYLDYFNKNAWKINQRTSLSGFVPDDMDEWSGNIFQEKSLFHLIASVSDPILLSNKYSKDYQDIINIGEDSQRIFPTLYDFLMNRAIEESAKASSGYTLNTAFLKSLQKKGIQIRDLAMPSSDFAKLDFSGDDNLITLHFYKEFISSLIDRNNNEALVLTELKKNNYLSSRSENYRTKYAYQFLLDLEQKNRSFDYNVEIIDALIAQLYSSSYGYYWGVDNDNKENLNKIYDWCIFGIDRYPHYNRINILKQRLASLENPIATITGQSVYHPDNKTKKFKLTYKNINSAIIKIEDKKTRKVVETKKIILSPKNTYSTDEYEFMLDLSKVGEYSIVTQYDKKKEESDREDATAFSISRLATFARVSGDDQYEFYIVDRLTGRPLEKAVVTIYFTDWAGKKYTKVGSVETDEKGLAVFDSKPFFNKKDNLRYVYKVAKNEDALPEYTDFPNFYNYTNTSSYGQDIVNILTDRSIYRPGQNVHFKVISTKIIDQFTTQLNANANYKVVLYNSNNQIVSEQNFTTNEFGSLAGEFVLPRTGLLGQYRISVGNDQQYFSVEEYKRPTFQIVFDKLNKTYSFGDEVKLRGRVENFSGIKIQGAMVDYSIQKTPIFRSWVIPSSETVDEGAVVTTDDGTFEMTFKIPENDTRRSWFNSIFNFRVQATVTDINGETQSENFNFAVGDVSLILSADVPTQLDRESKDRILVKAANLSGQPVAIDGSFIVYSVLPNDSINKQVLTGSFSTKKDDDLMSYIAKLPSAKYLLSLQAKDDKGRDALARSYFTLYSVDDKRPPIITNQWLIQKNVHFNLDKPAEIIFGVSADNATILYDLVKGNQVVERKQFMLSDSNKKLIIPYKEEYGDNVSVCLTYVIDEEAYTTQIMLEKEDEPKNLTLKFEVFRDKLRPGEHEQWRISIKDNKDKPAMAELLASMYDSSLDKLRASTQWQFRQLSKRISYPSSFRTNTFGQLSDYTNFIHSSYTVSPFNWDYLNWFGFGCVYSLDSNSIRVRGVSKLAYSPISKDEESAAVYCYLGMQSDEYKNLNQKESVENIKEKIQENISPEIRSNFSETAFFYPQLRTDEKGEIFISFTVPESNTTWRFRAIAYDKFLNIGKLEAITVSRKELMVTPNIPRFVRQGDRTSISTKISNLSDKRIQGQVRIEFFDPLTDKVRDIKIDKGIQNFSLEKDASESVYWLLDIPSDIEMLGCRIVAESESFSDGEQHVLSVLPNEMLVTESMAMNINGSQTKDFIFDRLINNKSNTSTNYRLTLEYADNPAWYAVQALPSLSNPTSENAVNWFASYYVNTLGAAIVRQYPKVANMIEAWKKQGGNKELLISNLQNNDELKSVLLEETPWVLDAKDETEQMQRLSLLFDLNQTNNKTSDAINKLKELQNQEGGWSWYKGMHSNRSVTQYVLYGFSQLINLNVVEYPSVVKEMQIKALNYLDRELLKDFENLKKSKQWEKSSTLSTTQLEYLYVRSAYRDIPIDQPTRVAERFFTNIAEKNWSKLSLYERSLLVVLCQRNGNKDLVNKIMQSIREHATMTDEMGMFWANNTSQAFMSRSAISVHTFVMDAFKVTNASLSEMNMLKQWLLKQKQTQLWESTHATMDAIFALLSSGDDWFSGSSTSQITVGQQKLEPANKELGTGYIKQTWPGDQISSEMGHVQVKKFGSEPSWGAMYWQYFEQLDNINAKKGELTVEKKLFVEKSTSNGKTLVQINENDPLKIGDKVVMRLTVRADRDLDFVHLKDMRASCFEPIEPISGLRWQNALYYYQSNGDASTNFFFDHLPKGTYVFEYPVYVNRLGEYLNGITTIQCMYAPEFVSHTQGIKVLVKE